MSVVGVDASQLSDLASRLAATPRRSRLAVDAAVKRGAQNVKAAIRADLSGSSVAAFRRIPVSYEIRSAGVVSEADIAPERGGAGNLANIAFFGTSRGGGTHRFYEHGEEELDTLASYVAKAAGTI